MVNINCKLSLAGFLLRRKKLFSFIYFALLNLLVAFFIAGDNLYAGGLTIGDTLLRMPLSVESAALGMAKVFDSKIGNPSFFISSPLLSTSSDSVGGSEINFGYSPGAIGTRLLEASGFVKKDKLLLGAGFYQQNAGTAQIHRLPFETTVEEIIFSRNLQTDNIFTLTFGYMITKNFSLGIAPRYLVSRLLEKYEFSILTLDCGFTLQPWKLFGRRAFFTTLVSNMGSSGNYVGAGTFSDEKFPLPLTYSIGISYNVSRFADILFYEDYLVPESKYSFGCGAEFRLSDETVYPLNSVSVRIGWRLPYGGLRKEGTTIIENSTLGFSLGFSEYLLSYAFLPLDDVGFSHKVGFTYRFGHKTKVPDKNIVEKTKIVFINGKFDESSFVKLEDMAQLLKENTSYTVRVEGDLENVDRVMDYFVNTERLPESIFIIEEKEIDWVDITLIKK